MSDQVKSKEGEPINEGDHVLTKIRGGRREGDVSLSPPHLDHSYIHRRSQVDKIVTTQEDADEAGVKNPPK
ncbi:hypothetical protein LTS18_012654, partial [Coniosporium uncinatum]